MNCDVYGCGRRAKHKYTASLSKRVFFGCDYHIQPFRQYIKNGATVERIDDNANAPVIKRCSNQRKLP